MVDHKMAVRVIQLDRNSAFIQLPVHCLDKTIQWKILERLLFRFAEPTKKARSPLLYLFVVNTDAVIQVDQLVVSACIEVVHVLIEA